MYAKLGFFSIRIAGCWPYMHTACAVEPRYNMKIFLRNTHKKYSIAWQWRWSMECPLEFNVWSLSCTCHCYHDDVIKWKHFPRYWPFVRGIQRSPVNSPHKDQWRGTLMFPLICAWIKGWANSPRVSDLRHHRAHYDVTVMAICNFPLW